MNGCPGIIPSQSEGNPNSSAAIKVEMHILCGGVAKVASSPNKTSISGIYSKAEMLQLCPPKVNVSVGSSCRLSHGMEWNQAGPGVAPIAAVRLRANSEGRMIYGSAMSKTAYSVGGKEI